MCKVLRGCRENAHVKNVDRGTPSPLPGEYVPSAAGRARRRLSTKTTRAQNFEILVLPQTTYYKGEQQWIQNVNAVNAANAHARTVAINLSRNTKGV